MAKGKYKEWLTADNLLVVKGWARDGALDKEIAQKIGISCSTFYDWCNKYSEFAEAIKKGRTPFNVAAEDALEKNIEGYFVNEEITEITQYPDGREVKHKRINKRYIKPDPTLIIFYNKCRNYRRFNDHIVMSDDTAINKLDEILKGIKDNAEAEIKSETE